MSNPLAHVIEPGIRVEIAPHYDLWMRGARYGVVRSVTDGIVAVKMDHPGVRRLFRCSINDVNPMAWSVK